MSEGTIQMVKIIENAQPAVSEAHDRYLQPKQAQKRRPTSYESLLGDAIERAFGAGIHDLPGLVASLNSQNSTTPDNQPWTEANYRAVMQELGR